MLNILFKTFIKNIWTLFYSLSITTGIYISLQELHEFGNRSNFFTFSIILFLIFTLEIFITWQSNQIKSSKTIDFKDAEKDLVFALNRLLLPITLYVSLVAFAYYNYKNSILLPILAFTFVTFFVLFLNIKAYFERRKNQEANTHYVYDIIKFLIFFNAVNVIINLVTTEEASLIVGVVYTFILSFLLKGLMLWRLEKLKPRIALFSILSSIFIAFIFAVLSVSESFNQLESTLILTFIFYLTMAATHHIFHKTLSLELIAEYFLISLVIVSIAYGIN